MILPDINVLVYAHRREAERHDEYAVWLAELVSGPEQLALADVVLSGFVRIVTNPRIMTDPTPTTDALTFVDRLVGARRSTWTAGNATTWSELTRLVADDHQARGNLIPDAYIAALAITHGCRVATRDRGFARFDGVRHFDPADA